MKPPQHSTIEISLFGKSSCFGESMLLHLKNDEWMLIDSFVVGKKPNKKSVAIDYLFRLYGEKWKEKIKVVLITHYHDDHIKGIADVVLQLTDLHYLALPQTLSDRKFSLFVEGFDEKLKEMIDTLTSRVNLFEKQIKNIYPESTQTKKRIEEVKNDIKVLNLFRRIEELKKLERWLKNNSSKYLAVGANTTLRYKFFFRGIGIDFLAPVAGLNFETLQFVLNNYFAKSLKPNKLNENELSVVVRIVVELFENTILLGGDCENHWQNIINENKFHPQKSDVYKVAHHGSENGFDEAIWENLLTTPSISLLSPYKKGSIIPKPELIKRIKKLSGEAYITQNPYTTFEEMSYGDIVPVEGYGHIRLRKDVQENQDSWDVKLFGGALSLEEIQHSV